jgi:hypothetical protein
VKKQVRLFQLIRTKDLAQIRLSIRQRRQQLLEGWGHTLWLLLAWTPPHVDEWLQGVKAKMVIVAAQHALLDRDDEFGGSSENVLFATE